MHEQFEMEVLPSGEVIEDGQGAHCPLFSYEPAVHDNLFPTGGGVEAVALEPADVLELDVLVGDGVELLEVLIAVVLVVGADDVLLDVLVAAVVEEERHAVYEQGHSRLVLLFVVI